jgi:sortase A
MSVRRASRYLELLLLAAGIGCLAVYGAAGLHARMAQARAERAFDEAMTAAAMPADPPTVAAATCPPLPGEQDAAARAQADWRSMLLAPPAADQTSWDPERRRLHAQAVSELSPDAVLARLDVPSMKLSVFVLPGTDAFSLNGGVGHIPGTARPGEPGNVGLAGHRDGFFRGLGSLATGDVLRLTTPRGSVEYHVEWTRIVDPSDVDVLAGCGKDALTLVTCYPFRIVGHAPKRYIVRATRSGAQT